MATEYPFIGKTGDQTEYVAVIRKNEQSVVQSLTIDATNSGMSAGPITVETTATVTVDGYWSIV